MNKILVIEDDIYLREELVNTFIKKGYSASSISSFIAPEADILSSKPDLVVLDINLPGKSGFELCKWLKARAAFPILVLTARDTLSDELYTLGLGADDFLVKPCHPDRLIARVERLLQIYRKMGNMIQVGDLILDTDTYNVIWRQSHLILSETEGKILRVLLEAYPAIVYKQDLFIKLWGSNAYVDENILQVNIARLRKSLDTIGLRNIIRTERGHGYRLEVSEA